jgi:hypothetical protein
MFTQVKRHISKFASVIRIFFLWKVRDEQLWTKRRRMKRSAALLTYTSATSPI